MPGPKPLSAFTNGCCAAARQIRLLLHVQNQAIGELVTCGQNALSLGMC